MDTSDIRILLVDDEEDILEFLTYSLRKEGFGVAVARNGKEALKLATDFNPNIILLDVMMPEMDGIETCEEIRRIPALKETLVVFLTARGEDYSQIAGLEAGADDYITKPIKPKVLLSRIRALLRRQRPLSLPQEHAEMSMQKSSGRIQIDRERYLVIKDGVQLDLPRKEFELLALLFSKPQRVFTRDEIYHQVWGDDTIVGERTIDVHIRKLREKIGEDYIRTIKGVGYKFVEND